MNWLDITIPEKNNGREKKGSFTPSKFKTQQGKF